MKVPYSRPHLTDAEISEMVETLRSGWLTTGGRTHKLEKEFAAFCGTKHAVAVFSCTNALHLALLAVDFRPGDIAVLPTLTFGSTANVVIHAGGIPLFVDSDPKTLCMDPEKVESSLQRLSQGETVSGVRSPLDRVKVIMPVHYAGQMADSDRMRKIADRFGMRLIEDAAHANPSRYRSSPGAPWRRCGETADLTCFSFYANKCITTGEGGMVVTDNDDWAHKVRLMRLHGIAKDHSLSTSSWEYDIVLPGFKCNMMDLQAAIGIHQLRRLHQLWGRRKEIAAAYDRAFADVAAIETPTILPGRVMSWHMYVIRLRLEKLSIDRRRFILELDRLGVGTTVCWKPVHMHPYYRERFGFTEGDFPVASGEFKRAISLPIFPSMTDEELNKVIESVGSVAEKHRL
ncbi:DegT/DnrJ/EryC1/StrS aminotransferase family protein [bacterium]|nr:DegT/DnrJ/EryC1/StrS aminotransferase family protein [bacterium]